MEMSNLEIRQHEKPLLPYNDCNSSGCRNISKKMKIVDVKWYLRKRYYVALFAGLGMICFTFLRANLSIVMTEVASRKVNATGDKMQKQQLNWTSTQKGILMASVFYGTIPMTFISGILATRYGGRTVIGIGLTIGSILTIGSPFLMRYNWIVYAIVRAIEGCTISVILAGVVDVSVHWYLPSERARLTIFTETLSRNLGYAISHSLCGIVLEMLNLDWVFYVTGSITLIWSGVWFLCFCDYPGQDKLITRKEKNLLESAQSSNFHVDDKPTISSYPWKEMIRSKPAWALINEYFCKGWVSSFVIHCLPLYVKDISGMKSSHVGFVSSLPLFCAAITDALFSIVADYIRSSHVIQTPTLHRILIGTSQIGVMLTLGAVSLWANFEMSIVLFSIIHSLIGIGNVSYCILPIDMFAKYAAIIGGFCTSAYTIASALNVMLLNFFIKNHERSEWNVYFLCLVAFNIWSLVMFCTFGSGELQPWADSSKNVPVIRQERRSSK